MKCCKIVCIVTAVVLFAAIGGLILYLEEDGEETEQKIRQDIPQVQMGSMASLNSEQAELYERLCAFAQVLYEYDTEERMFYEGAEEFMTQEANQTLHPGAVEEDGDSQRIRVKSRLISVNVYAYYKEETGADVIMESLFSLSNGTNDSLTQYLKLSLVKQDGSWMITACSAIDTIER